MGESRSRLGSPVADKGPPPPLPSPPLVVLYVEDVPDLP